MNVGEALWMQKLLHECWRALWMQKLLHECWRDLWMQKLLHECRIGFMDEEVAP
ncbi:hypothetical protein DPMN_024739 [Dreissena polymorpha]|uniref:Uncharacterized protein n=1 Tax=Dreissena polymorpha TaxID=45954 RepID=A0A9D4LQ40_DREPO|nr:hypothetical protein DPMN_024739 [Dreissena polymorpha]